jgi:hypothetical protein
MMVAQKLTRSLVTPHRLFLLKRKSRRAFLRRRL